MYIVFCVFCVFGVCSVLIFLSFFSEAIHPSVSAFYCRLMFIFIQQVVCSLLSYNKIVYAYHFINYKEKRLIVNELKGPFH
ncbi:hypothetical protein J3Q64DRAFT_1769457 [Phycomyces blakesleeanus]|uniref:Secreted protein n=1 Tax=Phycomyces blakesleeanus TaxID=4837 RepID=A0ABR3ALM5_PHYBL